MAVNLTDRNQVDRLINTVILVSVPVSLYGIIQHNGLDPLPWAGDVTKRVASNMGNAIFVASYLIMIVPLTVSRLIKSMAAIVTEENASWGHTILSAIYIFVLAIQILTILYSRSRGPQVGLLGAFALMGLLVLLLLRQQAEDKSKLSIREAGLGVALVGALTLGAGLGGGLGYLGGTGIDALLRVLRLEAEGLPLLGAALGALIGFAGVYTYLAAAGKGWRWLWMSWPVITIGAIVFVLLLNLPNGPLQPLKQVPYLGRLGQLTNIEGGTGKVRVLIWEGALNLISPHRPIGIEEEFTDPFNAIRPLVGYGPESMFNAFAYVYPPELAHVEARGSSADRSHNETMDSLVMTGVLGFAAFYFLMGSLFYYALRWLGWVSSRKTGYWLIGLMIVASLLGIFSPYLAQGNFTLSAVFLPFSLFVATFLFFCGRGFLAQPDSSTETSTISYPLLLIGILSALIGHFLEVHFVFSIAATYTYFWLYLGLMVALHRMQGTGAEVPSTEPEPEVEESTPPASKQRRRRGRGRTAPRRPVTSNNVWTADGWEVWFGSQGLVMAIVLIILAFDFIPIVFDIKTGNYSLLWMTTITFLVGMAITASDTAIRKGGWRKAINWGWGITLYLVTSLGYAGFYLLLHAQQRRVVRQLAGATNERLNTLNQLTDPLSQQEGIRLAIQTAVESANGVFNLLLTFYIALLILLLILAFMLIQGKTKRLSTWRSANWWLYPPLALALALFISFKNINVVKADLFLKEGQKYRDARLWDLAIAIHEEGVNADPDEDFYYLMLALDYQLKAQDQRLSPQERQLAWQRGEEIALEARNINKFNPDNTGNIGRYYFTIAQIFDRSYYDKALDFFQKAVELAPQNVDYYNLVGQVHYALGDYDKALTWYGKSAEIDDRYFPTQLYKGDTHVAKQEIEEAVKAHLNAIELNPAGFVDDNFDTRLNFYVSINRTEDLIAALQESATQYPEQSPNRGKILWAIGHSYLRAGNIDQANRYLQEAIAQGYDNTQAYIEIGDTYLAQEQYSHAEQAYELALAKNTNLPQVHSSLGYIYARTGRLEQAIAANNKVLESLPNDYDSNKNLALLYQQAGQLEQGLKHAEIALEVAPEAAKEELRSFISQLEQQLQQKQPESSSD